MITRCVSFAADLKWKVTIKSKSVSNQHCFNKIKDWQKNRINL